MANTNPPKKSDDSNGGGRKPRKRKPDPGDKFEWRKATKTLTFWILIVILSGIVFRQLNLSDQPEITKSYSQYRKLLESGQISAAEIIDHEFHGTLKDGGAITTTLPFIDVLMLAEWDSLRIDYQFREKTTSWLGYLITSILPWVIIIGIWLYIMRRMQGGGSRGVFSFGKSRAKLLVENKPKVTFNDVAGVDEAKEELEEIIGFLRDPKRFSRLGGRIPKGALLLGPPGTGKTLLARAIAGEADVPFYSMSGADFVEMFVGVGAARVRDLFEQGKKNAPCIIFIDEIDAVGRHRGAGLGGGHDEREQTLNQLLVEMDGFEGNDGVILLAATNRPDVLDPALTRPGRFDRQIVVDRPDVRGREGILRVHSREIPLAANVKLNVLAKGTPGLAGADLANMVNEAALLAARRGASKVNMTDFEEAKDKVMMGTERKSLLISEDEKRQTAFHEAGHVLVAKMTPGSDPVHKVTIIPRGRALGLTHYLPLDEKHNYSRSYLNMTLTHLLGGRAAERLIFNELSTGAGNDIERATEIARKMVCEWGMSDKLGPVALGRKQEEIFLGRDIVRNRDYSEHIAQDIDSEIRRIVSEAEKRAEKILSENTSKLRLIAEALLEREILDGNEIDTLIAGRKLRPVSHKRRDPRSRPPRKRTTRSRPPARTKQRSPAPSTQNIAAKTKERPLIKTTRERQSVKTKPHTPVKAQPHTPVKAQPHTPVKAQPHAPVKAQPRAPVKNQQRSPAKTGSTPTSGARARRDFAKSYGIASSRDPENRRPAPTRMSKTIRLVPKKEESDSDDGKRDNKTSQSGAAESKSSGTPKTQTIRPVRTASKHSARPGRASSRPESDQRLTTKPDTTKPDPKPPSLFDRLGAEKTPHEDMEKHRRETPPLKFEMPDFELKLPDSGKTEATSTDQKKLEKSLKSKSNDEDKGGV